jgi:hypothetical protein
VRSGFEGLSINREIKEVRDPQSPGEPGKLDASINKLIEEIRERFVG